MIVFRLLYCCDVAFAVFIIRRFYKSPTIFLLRALQLSLHLHALNACARHSETMICNADLKVAAAEAGAGAGAGTGAGAGHGSR